MTHSHSTARIRENAQKLMTELRMRKTRGGKVPMWIYGMIHAAEHPRGTKLDTFYKADAETMAQRGFAVIEANPGRRPKSRDSVYLVTLTPAAWGVLEAAGVSWT